MRILCTFSIYSLKPIRKNLCIWIIILKMHYELFCHQIIFMGSTSIKCIQFLMKDRLESLKISSILYFFSSSYEPHTLRCLYFLFFDTFFWYVRKHNNELNYQTHFTLFDRLCDNVHKSWMD